ncbi:MAG: TetR/AcrR family transcriptional regulator C-terminal domain-containing protein [Clostridia bacterium]|nr:TetR/AcrR family transcriptional regulator C-terminal domain-containing protein [Clostridia bacterium]
MRPSAKAAIVDTFKQLVQSKSIDKITVTEICEIAEINRQTFYYHFANLFDIFKYYFRNEVFGEIAQNRTFDTWCSGFLATMNYLKRNSRMILNVYDSTYRNESNTCFIEISNQLLDQIVDECMNTLHVDLPEQDCRFIINFYRHVFNGLMMDWVAEGMKEEPDALLKKLQIMINGSVSRSIEAFSEERKRHWATEITK